MTDLKTIMKETLNSNDFDYGYYGSKTFAPKRWLWWKRLTMADDLYLKNRSKIDKNNVLDFGCAFGFFSSYLSHSFKKVYLVEKIENFLNQGVAIHKKFGSNNYTTLMNQIDDSSFFVDKIADKIDLFLFFDVLEHVRNIDNFLLKLKGISSNNSYLLISLPTENWLYMLLTKFKKEKGHCNRYFEVVDVLKKYNYQLIAKKSLLSLFNIYLYKV